MKIMKCEICKNQIKVKEVKTYRDEDSGLPNLVLKNVKVEYCSICSTETPLIPRVLVLLQTVARAIVEKPAPLIGEEIRFLRKNLRIKAQDFAKMIRTKKETLSRWENNEQAIGLQSDLVIRLAYVRMWEEKNEKLYQWKIIEKTSELTHESIEIVVDAANAEEFSYRDSSTLSPLSSMESELVKAILYFSLSISTYENEYVRYEKEHKGYRVAKIPSLKSDEWPDVIETSGELKGQLVGGSLG